MNENKPNLNSGLTWSWKVWKIVQLESSNRSRKVLDYLIQVIILQWKLSNFDRYFSIWTKISQQKTFQVLNFRNYIFQLPVSRILLSLTTWVASFEVMTTSLQPDIFVLIFVLSFRSFDFLLRLTIRKYSILWTTEFFCATELPFYLCNKSQSSFLEI